jgi:hypothetical protein
MQLLLPGEDIKFSDPADVGGSYEAFQYRTLLACCSASAIGGGWRRCWRGPWSGMMTIGRCLPEPRSERGRGG